MINLLFEIGLLVAGAMYGGIIGFLLAGIFCILWETL